MKSNKIIYWISTSLLCLMMFGSAMFYFTQYDTARGIFEMLGFPEYIIYPLATLKMLGVIAIITKRSAFLKQMAYAGFFFDFLLALSAHLNAGDGGFIAALMALIFLIVSYIYDKKVFNDSEDDIL